MPPSITACRPESPLSSFGPITVPAGEYLMPGDNRDDRADSRYFGYFPRDEIMGRVRRVASSLNPAHLDRPGLNRCFKRLDAQPVQG